MSNAVTSKGVFKGIKTSYVDNELIVFAVSVSTHLSYKLCRVTGENYQSNEFSWKIGTPTIDKLNTGNPPPGEYDIVLVGVNWGGPSNFKVSIMLESGDSPLTEFDPEATTVRKDQPVGAVWTPDPVRVTITA